MWFNPTMKWLINSPLHFIVNKNTMLITFMGRKSGKTISTAINYLKGGTKHITISLRKRLWWHGLRNGDPIQQIIKRERVIASPKVIGKEKDVFRQLITSFNIALVLGRYYKVEVDKSGLPKQYDTAMLFPKETQNPI